MEDGLRKLKDGSYVEGVAQGGKVLIVRTDPEFVRDIAPYFANSIMVFVALVMVMTTNRFYLPVFFVFIVSPIQNKCSVGDNKNLSVKSQVKFSNDKRFDFPLQFFVVFDTLVYIWALIIMSDEVNPSGYWFSL